MTLTCTLCNKSLYTEFDGTSRKQQPSRSSQNTQFIDTDHEPYIVDNGVVYCSDNCAPRELRDDPPETDPLVALVEFFHEQNTDESIEYYHNRGWTDETITDRMLGWAPPDEMKAYKHLQRRGYSNAEILSTGAFSVSETPPYTCNWRGRYIIPYFDTDGEIVYAISRSTGSKGGGAVGYDGHPQDVMNGKYAKLSQNKPFTVYTEPLYGKDKLDDLDQNYLIITEGAPDVISALQEDMPVLSPVTTSFTADQYDSLVEMLEEYPYDQIYIVPDNEPVQNDRDRSISVGLEGGLKEAAEIKYRNEEIPLEIVLPPKENEDEKVDLDNYLYDHTKKDFEKLAQSSGVDPESFDEYDEIYSSVVSKHKSLQQVQQSMNSKSGDGSQSALYSLGILDVLPPEFSAKGDRGPNPIQHTGDSRNYFSVDVVNGALIAHDFKRDTTYTPLTYILCELNERDLNSPNGSLSNREIWLAWKWAKENGVIPKNDPVPSRDLQHIAQSDLGHQPDDPNEMLPYEVYKDALGKIEEKYQIETGRNN